MAKNVPSFLLKLVFVLSALLLIPTLSSVTANTSPISIQITDTVNDCLDDANGTSPIETMLVDANGYQQVTTTWSLYEGCTISPVVPDALIDLEARDVVISLWATSAKITLQSGLNLAIGNLILDTSNHVVPGSPGKAQFTNYGSISVLGLAEFNGTDHYFIENYGEIHLYSDVYLDGDLQNYGAIHFYGGFANYNGTIFNNGFLTTNNLYSGAIYLYCIGNTLQHAGADVEGFIQGDLPLYENCKPYVYINSETPLEYYGMSNGYHISDPQTGMRNQEFPFFITPQDTIFLDSTYSSIPGDSPITYFDDNYIDSYSHDLVLDCDGCESPQKGTLNYDPISLELEYSPDSDGYGPDQFSYQLCDSLESWHFGEPQCTDLITIYIYIVTPPTANPASASTLKNVRVDIEFSYYDLDGLSGPLIVELVDLPQHAGIPPIITQSGSTYFRYTPDTDWFGTDTFTYKACDTLGACSQTATVTVEVIENQHPIAEPDTVTVLEHDWVTIPVLANDTDPDGQGLDPGSLSLVTSSPNAESLYIENNSFVYRSVLGFHGQDTFTYKICDVAGACSEPGTVTIDVIENQHPIANTDFAYTVEHTWVEIPVLVNDSDPDGHGLDLSSLSLHTSASHAEALLLQDQTFVYRPAWGWQGSDSFTYEICDTLGVCSLGQVNITIGENHPPTGTDDWYITDVNTPIALDLYTNDTDPDGNIVTELYFDTGLHEYNYPVIYHSTLTYTESDGLIYTPPQDFVGFEEFDYYVIDQAGAYFKAHVVISVGAHIYLSEDMCTVFNMDVNEGDLANVVCPLSLPQNAIFSSQVGTVGYSDGNFTWDFLTSDGDAESQQVLVEVFDPFDNLIGAIFIDLTVNNVPPTINSMTLSPMPLMPDQTMTVTATFSDPAGTKDEFYTCEVDFGDGSQPVTGTVSGYTCTADHRYATPGIYVVWVTITDKDGGSDTKSSLDFAGSAGSGLFEFDFSLLTAEQIAAMCGTNYHLTVDEGQDAGLECSFFLPPNVNLHSSLEGDYIAYQSGKLRWDFLTSDGPAETQTVVLEVYNDSGLLGLIKLPLKVLNVAPSIFAIDISPLDLTIGGTVLVSTGFTDPAGTKDEPYTCTVDFGDGTVLDGTVTDGTCTASHSYATPGIYVVWVTVEDRDGGSDTKSNLDFADGNGGGLFKFDLSQIKDVCTAYNLTVDEGSLANFDCAFLLPAESTLSSPVGNTGYTGGKLTWDFQTSDGPAESQPVTLAVSYAGTTIGFIYFDLTVNNVPPVIDSMTLSPTLLQLGETMTVSSTFNDPAGTIDKHTCKVDFGDGSQAVTGTVNGGTCTASHSYTAPGIYIVKVTVTDKDGGSDTKTNLDFTDGNGSSLFTFDFLSLTPEQIAAMCTTYNLSVDEGEDAALDCTFSLPAGLTLNSPVGNTGYTGGKLTWDFQTSDGPAESQRVTLTVSNAETTIGYIFFDLVVNNVSPVIDSMTLSPALLQLGETMTVSSTFSDPAGTIDKHTCKVDFGDGTVFDGEVGDGTCTASHSYTAPGIYIVKVTITDKDGGSDTKSNLDFNEGVYLIVYDPAGGFVTGGGWIESPAGAYAADPTLTGKATFGFVSKYKKGAKVPTGSTEFHFKAGDLNFHSSSYDWLVVSQGGEMAQFKGTGTINGEGVYKFMIRAGDSESDTFRITIWEEDELGKETVIYDNGVDQVIEGGSIIIHTGK